MTLLNARDTYVRCSTNNIVPVIQWEQCCRPGEIQSSDNDNFLFCMAAVGRFLPISFLLLKSGFVYTMTAQQSARRRLKVFTATMTHCARDYFPVRQRFFSGRQRNWRHGTKLRPRTASTPMRVMSYRYCHERWPGVVVMCWDVSIVRSFNFHVPSGRLRLKTNKHFGFSGAPRRPGEI